MKVSKYSISKFVLTLSCVFGIYEVGSSQTLPYTTYEPEPNKVSTKVYASKQKNQIIKNNAKSDTIVLMDNTISFHPFSLVDGTVSIGYERVVNNRKNAARVILGYTKLDQAVYYESKIENFEQMYAELNYKFFLSRRNKTAPVGLYASPFVQFRNATYNYHVTDTFSIQSNKLEPVVLEDFSSYSFAAGVMLGYSAIVLEMITLEAYFGIGQQSVNGDYKIHYDNIEYKPLNTGFFWNNGPLFKLGCSIGVNF